MLARTPCSAVILALGLGIAFFAAAAETSDTIVRARDAAIRKLDLQLDFPKPDTPPGLHWNLGFPDIPPVVFWVLLAVGVALALWSLRDSILSWGLPGRSPRPDEAGESGETDDAHDSGLTASADALARAGRYGEAIHALLLQSLAEIRAALAEPFADSLTSREILRGTRLAPEGRRSLAEIISHVELTHFGGRAAGEADYLACRRSFDALGAALAATAGS